jgi:hypothetical protein
LSASGEHRQRIDRFWALTLVRRTRCCDGPSKSIGQSPAATALRIETEDLIAELGARRPELVAKSNGAAYLEAVQYATVAAVAELSCRSGAKLDDDAKRIIRLLGIAMR